MIWIDDLDVPKCELELLEGQKYDQFCSASYTLFESMLSKNSFFVFLVSTLIIVRAKLFICKRIWEINVIGCATGRASKCATQANRVEW